jgi:hypothetical protein
VIDAAVDSVIERRLLVNYRIEPARVAALLPAPLRPQLQRGWAVGGLCLLRLGELRLPGMPRPFGLRTENAGYRFAVEWDDANGTNVGVFVERRDTSSHLTAFAGGRVFPGQHHLARFVVDEHDARLRIDVSSRHGEVGVAVVAHEADELGGELFACLDEALAFFRRGSLGWSPGSGGLDGVRLEASRWEGRPVAIEQLSSSVFDDQVRFPGGSCVLDSAFVMRGLPARWVTEGRLVRRTDLRAA